MRVVRLFLLFTACLLTVASSGAPTPQKPSADSIQPKASRPFSIGERLVYLVKWDPPWYLFFPPRYGSRRGELHLVGKPCMRIKGIENNL